MGVCCANEEADMIEKVAPTTQEQGAGGKAAAKQPAPAIKKEQLKDLPEVNWQRISNLYERFEQSLPFNRINVGTMFDKIDEAEKAALENAGGVLPDGVDPYVTLMSLRQALPTAAWRDLMDPVSALSKTLLSQQFKGEGHNADQIDVNTLKMFSLLHCASKKPIEKAKALYCILQDGGFEKHEQISATDKDFEPVFLKLCKLVTTDIFELANLNGGVSIIYSESECKDLCGKQNIEELREDDWLEAVYGAQSRLTNDQWLEKVTDKKGKASWIFNPKELRNKLFAQAGID